MLDRSIPYFHLIMRADNPEALPSRPVPSGYSIRPYRPGDEAAWARIETSVGEFDSEEAALALFRERYLAYPGELAERCFFAVAQDGRTVGTCMAWFEGPVSVLHWLSVAPEAQGTGLARPLVETVLRVFREKDAFPVWLHTQTWSHKAVMLYRRMGFRLLARGSFADRPNEYEKALPILRRVLPPGDYESLLSGPRE